MEEVSFRLSKSQPTSLLYNAGGVTLRWSFMKYVPMHYKCMCRLYYTCNHTMAGEKTRVNWGHYILLDSRHGVHVPQATEWCSLSVTYPYIFNWVHQIIHTMAEEKARVSWDHHILLDSRHSAPQATKWCSLPCSHISIHFQFESVKFITTKTFFWVKVKHIVQEQNTTSHKSQLTIQLCYS